MPGIALTLIRWCTEPEVIKIESAKAEFCAMMLYHLILDLDLDLILLHCKANDYVTL
jgi:hypothetical protein